MKKPITLLLMIFLGGFLMAINQAFAIESAELNKYLYPETTKTISLDFKNANLNDVLKIFSQQSGLNFIASTDVSSQSINLYLEEVPVEAALERILSANNLTYEIQPGSNIFVVKSNTQPKSELLTRVYKLKHISVPTSLVKATLSASEDNAPAANTEAAGETGIVAAISSVLSDEGSLAEDSRTNSLIITDFPSRFPIVEQTIARLDVRIPQILIEVEMLDITKQASEELGTKWGNPVVSFTPASKTSFFPFNQSNILGEQSDTLATSFTQGNLSFLQTNNFALNFFKSHSDTNVLARPKILTLDNQTAEINIKTDEAISISDVSESDTGLTTVEVEREETGVFLRVTPQANLRQNEITLAVEPKVVETTTGEDFGTGAPVLNPEERGSKSILRVRNGDTVMMGGLLRNKEIDARQELPFLANIPVFGAAFRSKDITITERELIIFLTPNILKENMNVQKAANRNRIIREQEMPDNRLSAINNNLSRLERRGY